MGGLGSGKWKRKDTKPVVTGAYRLDVGAINDELRRATDTGQAQAKAFSLAPFGERLLGVIVESLSVQLIFDATNGAACEKVRVAKTPCRFGGVRFWFACPCCDRLCGSLFLEGNAFLCRICSGRVYPVQNERRGAALDRAFGKARGRLVRDGQDNAKVYPARPKGMHRANYEALAARQFALLNEKIEADIDWIGRLTGRLAEMIRKRANVLGSKL